MSSKGKLLVQIKDQVITGPSLAEMVGQAMKLKEKNRPQLALLLLVLASIAAQ